MFFKYLSTFLIFSIKDIIEIFFICSILYYYSIWLKADKQKNLIFTFYSLLSVYIFANFTNMLAISQLFITFFPVILVTFFLIHQNTLQKNFIALKKIVSCKEDTTNWLDEFMRTCLNCMVSNKQITCIIEGNNSLNEFLKTSFNISSNINKELIDILINSQNFDEQKMLWITYKGKIHSINSTWDMKKYDLWIDENSLIIDDWQQNAIIFTSKFDCAIFRTYPEKRTIDIIIQGRLIENLSPNTALNLVDQFIKKSELKIKKDKNNHEIKFNNDWGEQQSCN